MRPRIPLAYAGFLIVALVAVVGFAAFSPSGADRSEDPVEPATADTTVTDVSARVASAILALRVTDTSGNVAPVETTSTDTTPETTSSSSSSTTTSDAELQRATTVDDTTSSTTPPTTTTKPKDTTPPALKITSPEDGATVTDRVVTFRGTTEPGAEVYSGPYEANVDEDGAWSIKLVVDVGGATARITAEDAAGNTTTESITVEYEAPAPPPPPSATTTTKPTTTTQPSTPKWSPLWPADSGGTRNVEAWRPLVEKYWPSDLVNCALNIIYFESKGDPRAYNSSGPGFEGLFQHHSGYWKARAAAAGFRDSNGLYATPYNAEANIAVSWYLARNSDPWDRHWSVDPHSGPLECTS
ncbi:MAG: hypothetical protein KDB69_02745 [Acidimicrobiia bacterium]|nr:hypothetical protein [Acidimicrobiia bacterium]